ncbi:hypothetical protein Tco_0604560 [Tanacetum coccineum]
MKALAVPDLEPMKEDQTGSDSGKLHVSLAGPNPEHMDEEFLATAYPKVHENLKLITDERVIDDKPESHSGSMSSMKNLDDSFNFGDQFLHDKPTEDDQEKSKVREESDSTIPDSSHQQVTSTPPVIVPFTEVSSSKPSLLVTPPPINTEATTITTSLPEITPFIALQLRVARLSKEMFETVKNQESKKSPKEIIRAKKEQDEEKQDSTYVHQSKPSSHRNFDSNEKTPWIRKIADKVNKEERNILISPLSGSAKPPPQADDQSQRTKGGLRHLLQTTSNSLLNWMARSHTQERLVLTLRCTDLTRIQNTLNNLSDDISKQDEIGMTQIRRNTDNAHIPKVSATTDEQERKKHCKSDLEVPSFNLVKAFTMNSKAQPTAQDRQTSPSTSSQHVDKKTRRFRNRVGDLQLGLKSYQTKINLERPNWDAADYYFKEDYTIVPKPRAVVYRDRNDQRKLMRLNELHKFSDGTLQGVMENARQWTISNSLVITHCGKSLSNSLPLSHLRYCNEHPSETIVFHNEDGNPARANIKQALGYLKDGDGDGYSQFLRCQRWRFDPLPSLWNIVPAGYIVPTGRNN